MRAREFITEQRELPAELAEPITVHLCDCQDSVPADPYNNYRFGVAMARARSNRWRRQSLNRSITCQNGTAETAFGEHGVVVGMNGGIEQIIDQALQMTKTPGGKELVSTADSQEPKFVGTASPVKAFKGYPR
jgi:hypothetical protein